MGSEMSAEGTNTTIYRSQKIRISMGQENSRSETEMTRIMRSTQTSAEEEKNFFGGGGKNLPEEVNMEF